ncbi:hypothetical protein CYMTET_42547 [Cymbomonas tetramitiformis]|uniref:Uncharacterized protein n=1 Tax=Cymbomonas tetramitiformis TaxID=36881 RepID=A0AAE0F1F3_9CHLO|nr:hypothetical protein CYMTET_42547 [Cymbomonas tetramitiformis]
MTVFGHKLQSTWLYVKGIYSYAVNSDEGVEAFRDMVVSAGAEARERFKKAGADVRRSRAVSRAFEESGDDFRDKHAVSELRKRFERQSEKDYSEEAMSHWDKTDVQVFSESKSVKKKLKKSRVTSVAAIKVMLETGKKGYIPPPLTKQADLAVYTRAAVKKRGELRKSLAVKKGILRWWVLLGFSGFVPNSSLASLARFVGKQHMKKKRVSTVAKAAVRQSQVQPVQAPDEYDETLEVGAITKGEYIQMCVEIWKVVGDPEEIDEADARKSAAKDWKEDSAGQKGMNYPLFFNAIFTLCDLYTVSAEEDEYEQFLQRCVDSIMRNRRNVPICVPEENLKS